MSLNKQLAEELHKPEKSMQDLKTIFGEQISLKWDHYLLRIWVLNVNCV